ncbi:hypothetical protein ACFSQJ_17750 [Croceitalea marina]|uniref:Uncharacterized protein n=1 Tax=Croceitalea marina TaxID=1775166 RepID=A0ABW5MZU4_9FLAO
MKSKHPSACYEFIYQPDVQHYQYLFYCFLKVFIGPLPSWRPQRRKSVHVFTCKEKFSGAVLIS